MNLGERKKVWPPAAGLPLHRRLGHAGFLALACLCDFQRGASKLLRHRLCFGAYRIDRCSFAKLLASDACK